MRNARLLLALLTLLCADAVVAQQASYASYGQGCQGPCRPQKPVRWCVPVLKALEAPRIGKRFRVTATGIEPIIQSVLLTGTSRDRLGSLRLPLHAPWFRKNCFLWTSGELATLTRMTSSDPVVEFQIPNDKSLVGAHLYQQWLFVIALMPSSDWFFSQGGHGVIGI